jgi:VCBS repeat-containing protein
MMVKSLSKGKLKVANETTTKTVASGTHLNAAGTVKTVIGLVKAIDVNGNERVLQSGDHVYPGETIQTAGDGTVLVEFPNGSHLDLPHSSHMVLDADIYAPTDSVEKQAEDEASRIERAIAEGRDPSIETDAAAAGGTGGDEGSSTPLVLNFNNTQGVVDSGFQTAPLANSFNSAQQDQQPTIPEAAPSITAATPGGTVLELANTTGSTTQDAASGTISFTDINPADVHTVSVKAEGTNYLGTFTPTLVADSTQTANGAGSVAWTFNVKDGALDFLAAGQTLTQKYDVTIDDGQGGTVTQVVTITIVGTNDAPVITSSANDAVGAVKEDTTTSASGRLSASDVDNGATQTWSIIEAEGGPSAAGQYGSLTVDAKTGAWTYTLNNDAKNVQSLAAGESHDETFTVRVTDDQGATAEQTVTITVTGTNDAPVITSNAAAAQGSVTEAGNLNDGSAVAGVPTATGTLTSSDVDNGATATWSIDGKSSYGSIAIDAATGKWI